jgi:hypothetical protein
VKPRPSLARRISTSIQTWAFKGVSLVPLVGDSGWRYVALQAARRQSPQKVLEKPTRSSAHRRHTSFSSMLPSTLNPCIARRLRENRHRASLQDKTQ